VRTWPAKRLRLSLVAVLALGVAGCGTAAEPAQTSTVTPGITESRTAPPEPEIPTVWPLTGVPVDAVADRPAAAVKIENSHQARPQSGLNEADVVWETIIDFDVSRLIAVFHSQTPDEIGPIRSVRPMDPSIVAPLHSPLVYSGGQQGILNLVPDAGIQGMNYDYGAAGMHRISSRSAPHNVYGSVQTFMDKADADHNSIPPQQFAFALGAGQASAALSGTATSTVSMRLSSQSSPSWTWDAASTTWLRSEGSTPATVASGARIAATNVVLIMASHPDSGFNAQGGAQVPTYLLDGKEGEALVATGGMTVAATWSKADQQSPIQLHTADGTELKLAPGNTWVEMVPTNGGSYQTS
jgi:hypothetical protein